MERTPKKLIVCCDGTWQDSAASFVTGAAGPWSFFFPPKNPIEQPPTNVTRIARALRPVDSTGTPQIVYYQAGVGTEGGIFSRLVAAAFGLGLAVNVREAYSFVAMNYVEGDEIYLLGFSRGAYTARSIAGLIGDLGLLTRNGLDFFLDIFNDWENSGQEGYKSALAQDDSTFSIPGADPADISSWLSAYRAELQRIGYASPGPIPIRAIGVWETVGALGIPVNPILQRLGLPGHIRPYRFFDTSLGTEVQYAFQALALDEHRAPYHPAIWEKRPGIKATLKQTWFPGVHTSVGGGYKDTGLSDITLAWMMSQLSPLLAFDPNYLRKQFVANQKVLTNSNVPAPTGLQWAASQLTQTASKLRDLLGVVTRTPGRYYRYDRRADRASTTQVLEDTQERVHYAVRVRERTGGLNARNKLVAYRPKAMEGYVSVDGEAGAGQTVWVYEGKDKKFEGKKLPEDELGMFERELIGYYEADGKTF